MQLAGNSLIRTLVALQFGAALGMGLLLSLFGFMVGLSGTIGGLIAASANGYFAYRTFVYYRAQEPERLARRIFGAEIQKLLLTGLMFALAIVYITPLSMGALLGCYLMVQVAVPLIVTHLYDRQQS